MSKSVNISGSKLPIEELHLSFLTNKLRTEYGFLESSRKNIPVNDKNEIIPNTKFSNPLKTIWYKYIKKEDPYSLNAVQNLLNKFKDNVHLIKGNSNKILKKIDMSKVDYVFLDGGHEYNTVMNDLNCCKEVIENNGTILCDDYDLTYAPGVKQSIDEFINKYSFKCEIICNRRFAKIEKY